MPELVLVDTNVLIDFERGKRQAGECLDEIESRSKLAVSAMTQMEMIVGCRNKSELRVLQVSLQRFEVIPISPVITTEATDILQRYNLSHGLLIADALIAATGLTIQAPLLTADRRDFDFIEGLALFPYP
jgi:hypothetical protein